MNQRSQLLTLACSTMLLAALHLMPSPAVRASIATAAAAAALPDRIADRVLGQVAFNFNAPGLSGASLNGPAAIAIIPAAAPGAGRLFVADYVNNRILSWPSAQSFSSTEAADLVIGQPNFASNDCLAAQNRLCGPEALAVDVQGNLFVADTSNHRVLMFAPPFGTAGMNASAVFGQSGYTQNSANRGGTVNAGTLFFPRGLAVDSAGNLFVADDYNNRVLRYSRPFAEMGMDAGLVIGQNTFSGSTAALARDGLYQPKSLAIDGSDQLYVAEYGNHRVTRFAPPFSTGMPAAGNAPIGQPNFTSQTPNNGGISAASLNAPVDLAISPAGDLLYVTDQQNIRVLAYRDPQNATAASAVYGQPSFATMPAPNNPFLGTTSLNQEPLGLAVGENGSLYVADFRNNRVLAFDPPPSLLNTNLIANAGAEATLGANDTGVAAPGGWEIISGELSATQYGASGGYPTAGDPGPANRGANFFSGGAAAESIAEQIVDLSSLGGLIDTGTLRYEAAAWLGGFLTQTDAAFVELNFRTAADDQIEQAIVGPVTPDDRANATGLLQRTLSGSIPAGTRRVHIRLHMSRFEGAANDGYVDNLSFVLRSPQLFLPYMQR